MINETQKQNVLNIIFNIESTLKMIDREFKNIGEVIGLDSEELEEAIHATIMDNDVGFSFSRSSKANYLNDPLLDQVCMVIDELADKKYKNIYISEDF